MEENTCFDYLFDKIDAGEELSSREKRYLIKNYEIERTIVCPSKKGRCLYVTSLCLYKNENYYKNKYYTIDWLEGVGVYKGSNEYPYQPVKVFPDKILKTKVYTFKTANGANVFKGNPIISCQEDASFESYLSDLEKAHKKE